MRHRFGHIKKLLTWAAVLAALASAFLLALLVPLILLSKVDLDWNRLSSVSQSYTAGATLISGMALLGIIWTQRLQIKQLDIVRGQATRQFQYDLLGKAMSDPVYASVIP